MKRIAPYGLAMILTFAALALGQVIVGPRPSADSLTVTPRGDRTGSAAVVPVGDVNRERVRRGTCYYACDQAAGVAPGTALGTTAMLVVYNPQNSGVLVCVHKVWAPYFSGTLGTGNLYHCVNTTTTQTAPSGGTVLANTPALAGNNNASVAVVRTGATVVQPVAVAPFSYLPPELATTVTAIQQDYDVMQDGVQLLPGTSYQLQAVAAAGTSPKLTPAVFWEEQALLNGQP